MSKIANDKYYTPISIANYCWEKVFEILGDEFSEIIEPSCGDGSFYHFHRKPDFGYDIEPEYNYDNIFSCDFLTHKIEYKKGRLVIGNPPYGRCLSLAQKFFKKSVEISDYIAFILPISQLNNINSMYEFDLVYSGDLGTQVYSDRELHCCLNIYKRPENGKLNVKPKLKLEDITIYRQDSSLYEKVEYDIRICYWGNGSAGKVLKEGESYSAEYKIKIHNEDLKDEIISLFNAFDWKEYLNCIAMRKIQQYHIIDVLKQNIVGIK